MGQAARLLIRFLADLPDDSVVLVRGRASGGMGPFEREVVALCRTIRLAVEVCAPWPIDPDGEDPAYIGREGVLLRDNQMVALADVVLAFITPHEVGDERFSGTRHVVDAALAKDVPVFLYAVSRSGDVERIGEHDESGAWSDRVPVAR